MVSCLLPNLGVSSITSSAEENQTFPLSCFPLGRRVCFAPAAYSEDPLIYHQLHSGEINRGPLRNPPRELWIGCRGPPAATEPHFCWPSEEKGRSLGRRKGGHEWHPLLNGSKANTLAIRRAKIKHQRC